MMCPNCHYILAKGENYCPKCGTQIIAEDNVRMSRTQKFKKTRNKSKIISYLLIGIFVLAFAIYAIQCVLDRGKEVSETKQPTVVLKLKEDELRLKVNETKNISTNKTCDYIVGDATICKINELGTVTALKEGTTEIICKSEDGQEIVCSITVLALEEAPELPEESALEDDYVFSDSDIRLLTEEDLKGTTQQQRRMAINEIYARHHCTFKNPEVIAYFSEKNWYHADPKMTTTNVPELFNEIEEKNVTIIRTYQENEE